MRWLSVAFQRFVGAAEAELGCEFDFDRAQFGRAFVRWVRRVERKSPINLEERRSYFDFAASLLARELAGNMPLKLTAVPTQVEAGSPQALWPEGYVCSLFCLRVLRAVYEQEFGRASVISARADEPGFWASYRENAAEDPRLAAGFFQVLSGRSPDWHAPDMGAPKD